MTHRYFLSAPLNEGDILSLDATEERHLKSVMRTKPGEMIEIINGKGELGIARFDKEITIKKVIKEDPPKKIKSLTLALTEPKHLELVIEKATELGVDKFYIFPSEKSKFKNLSENKKVRIDKILISSMKQSKRLFLPEVIYLGKKEDLPKDENYVLADFDGEVFVEFEESMSFIIGPESGFTKDEIIFFKEELSAKGILLSKNVLRTETAAICAACFLSL